MEIRGSNPLGALPLFEERPDRRDPLDRRQSPITDDDPLDDDPAEFLAPGGEAASIASVQLEDPRPECIESPESGHRRGIGEGQPR